MGVQLNTEHGILITLIVAHMGSCSEVKESSSSYKCCLSTTLHFNKMCKTFWSVNGKQFALTGNNAKGCIAPCSKIDSTSITLDACINVNATAVCSTAAGVVAESRIRYLSHPCPTSSPIGSRAPRSQGFFSPLLLTVSTGLFLLLITY